jgi:hypothetical protein
MQLHGGGAIVLYSVSTQISVSVIGIKESKGGSLFREKKENMYKILPRNSGIKSSLGGHSLNRRKVLRQILLSVKLRTLLSSLSIRFIATCPDEH